MNRIGVMQIIDSLAIGGLERTAVNLANCLPRDLYHSHLCVTRTSGPLEASVSKNVHRIDLGRTGRYDFGALWRLRKYIRENQIQILHAHGTSLFTAAFAARFKPRPAIIWHDQFGLCGTEERSARLYRSGVKNLGAIIAVNQTLADWARNQLRVPANRIWYIPNFVQEPAGDHSVPDLPGKKGARVVCVANLRPQKDHLNLLCAMKMVLRSFPEAHLILLGSGDNPAQLDKIKQAIVSQKLSTHVSWLGPRTDISAILRGCDVGVLSSISEGLPLALIEYGMAGLPSVATNVGQCAEVLDGGRCGILVPANSPVALSDGIVSFLQSKEKRNACSEQFLQRIRQCYSSDVILRKICKVYETVLNPAGL